MRDLTKAQFRAACARQGFRQVLLWLEDTTADEATALSTDRTSYGMTLNPNTYKPMRRYSLMRAINDRAKDRLRRRAQLNK